MVAGLGLAVMMTVMTAVVGDGGTNQSCRCLPDDPCWVSVPWSVLNASVKGRLVGYSDPMIFCREDTASKACQHALNASDDEFWLSDSPFRYEHTGQFNVWNISVDHAAYAVEAATESDFQATVAFASKHNLRLVVKGTGHDWYGRSLARGSLVLWTHLRKKIVFHDAFVPAGCSPKATPAVHAATVESGVQFQDLYPAAQNEGRLVIGGTCDSVGVGGCWLGGCYGTFSKKFGNGATNILEARVVLANGTLVTANACTNPDIYYALRGGGSGVVGVVTDFVAMTHPAPKSWSSAGFTATVKSLVEYEALLDRVLETYEIFSRDSTNCSDGIFTFGRSQNATTGLSNGNEYLVRISCGGYESNSHYQASLLHPLMEYAHSRGDNINAVLSHDNWTDTSYNPSDPKMPWVEHHPDRDIATILVSSISRYLPASAMRSVDGRKDLVEALVKITHLMPTDVPLVTYLSMNAKGQYGLPPSERERFLKTSQNPVLLDTVGTLLIMFNIPWFDQINPSSALLKEQWPRLQLYTLPDPADELWQTCNRGANGNESAAVACFNELQHVRFPNLVERTNKLRDVMWDALPNYNKKTNRPFSGSYWAETDYFDRQFQDSYWGKESYQKLLQIKKRHDPKGLFICHHCVGSEEWTEDLNCRLQ